MKKYEVTKELATLVKIMRIQNGIQAKELAAFLGRSPSYISKLEGGNVKTIRESELTPLLNYIVEGEDFYEDKLPIIVRTMSSFQEPGAMIKQIWLLSYDTLKRRIPVPQPLVEDLRERMTKLDIDASRLAEWINANIDSLMSTDFPANELIQYSFHDYQILLIRIVVGEEDIADLLDGKTSMMNYSTIHGIYFNIIRHELFGEDILDAEQIDKVFHETQEILSGYGVHSLTEYTSLMHPMGIFGNQQTLLSVLGNTSMDAIERINASLLAASEHDTLNAVRSLESFSKNLAWDTAFILKLMGVPFYKLENVSFNVKKRLLDDISILLKEYNALPASEKTMEEY